MATRHRPPPHPQPHITIPPGAAPPATSSPKTSADWDFRISDHDHLNLWHDDYRDAAYTPQSPDINFPITSSSSRPSSRPSSVHETSGSRIQFPEPHPFRASLRPAVSQSFLRHRSTKSDTNVSVARSSANRGESRPPSFISTESSPEFAPTVLSDELSNLTLDSEEGIRKFQAGLLDDKDEAWYKLVPPEAREVLDKKDVQRQSIIFEFIQSERDYVNDLQLVQEVFVDPLLATSPIPQSRIQGFVSEVFYNLNEILAHHRRMLDALFERQREQHPLIQSVADIVLDTSLVFRTQYEQYIKHYPLAEAHHRKELRRNPKYQYFLSQCSQDPRVRKRDFIIFLNRPITRLPRTILMLEQIQKYTALDHPDQEVLPLTLNILREFMKSTQPGIEAAEGKVKFWNLCETLAFQKGEIIELDLYDESRTLLYQSTLARRYKAEVGYSWADLHVALLDNYLLLLKKEVRPSGIYKHNVVSRPIPIEYLRLASFDAAPENRKDKTSSSVDHGKIFGIDSFRSRYRAMYPFTLYHASAMTTRRYTLYANSEAEREKWRRALVEAIGVRKVRQESNMILAPHTVNDTFFKVSGSASSSSSNPRIHGKIKCAALLSSSGKHLIAVGCPSGIYIAPRGSNDYKRVLKTTAIVSLHAIQQYNKILVHSDEGLDAYSLDLMARVALGTSRPQDLDASRERISGQDVAVTFARVETLGTRTLVLYATKSFMQVTLHSMEVVNPTNLTTSLRRSVSGATSFRQFAEPAWIPKDSHDITSLHKSIGVCAERGIHILDPTKCSSSSNATVVPTFADSNNAPMQALKQRCSSARPLGLVRTGENELLVVFDELGCYINRRGIPSRSSGYLRWETKAVSFARWGSNILLFSPEFIEIRDIASGRLVQVIEGQDIRGVHASDRAILFAMRGADGTTDRLVELVETADLTMSKKDSKMAALWDEWDM
ncbi:hypothetical protein BDY19DRAFT_1033671 [Irpex rosettiformis]|uniref:Uncharacterized protein n=1 Tax=Irpex rosettiformis TaxID=378272 RepID=A0ACB8UB03_9APHY|nr:hypothetical protein BDY19DRAFT_1033671 [Irpex rosettiformis]